MKYSVEKVDFWSGEIRDEVGGLAVGLRPLVDAGSNFVFVIARRQPDKPGSGLVFLGGLSGAKQSKAAVAAGFERADMPGLRIQAPDKAGTVESIVAQMAEAGINLRGVSASRRFAVLGDPGLRHEQGPRQSCPFAQESSAGKTTLETQTDLGGGWATISTEPKRQPSIHVRLLGRLSRFPRLSDLRADQPGRVDRAADAVSPPL